MISKAKSKFIKSLQIKKYRKQEQCFLVEGKKSVEELLGSDFDLLVLAGTPEFLANVPGRDSIAAEVIETTPEALKALGEFQSNDTCLAVARMKPNHPFQVNDDDFVLVLDDIRDPGNLGTIIRTADWYGVHKIVASPETADFYNPKVIHATMGSFVRVQLFYTDLVPYLETKRSPIFGAFLEGEDIHNVSFTAGGYVVMGNESQGISAGVEKLVTKKITIPRYGQAESLNAALATAVILDNLRRCGGR